MEIILDKSSLEDYTALVTLEPKYLALNFMNFFYQKLETGYLYLNKPNIYGTVAEFRIQCIHLHSSLSNTSFCVDILKKLSSVLFRLENTSIYPLLHAELQTVESLIELELAIKKLDFKNSVLLLYKTRTCFKKWIDYYPQQSKIHYSVKKILELQVQKLNFIFSKFKDSKPSKIQVKLNKLSSNSDIHKLIVVGITDNGLKKYTCMPSVNSETGLGLFPVLYSSCGSLDTDIMSCIVSIFYYWRRIGCSLKKLNCKNEDVKNSYLPSGHIVSLKDKIRVYDLLLLDSRIFVVLISNLKEHSSLVNERLLCNVLKLWSGSSFRSDVA